MAEPRTEPKFDKAFAIRFVVFGIVMTLVNLLPYLITRDAWKTDGVTFAGWPLRFLEAGGFVGHWEFRSLLMIGDVAIAVVLAAIGARICRSGIMATLRTLQMWGTPYAK